MSYSIKPILHHSPDKQGLCKIQILIIYKRMKFTLPTNYRVLPSQFANGRCKGFRNANDINGNLVALKDKYEKLLLSIIAAEPDKETLKRLFTKQELTHKTFYTYTIDLINRLTVSEGRLKHYRTLARQVKEFGDFNLSDLSPKLAMSFEKYLRELGLEQNTVNSKLRIFNAIKNYAVNDKLVGKDCIEGYKKPRYIQPIPEYLTEVEMHKFKSVVEASGPSRYKVAGYYFLLSCRAGYRLSDLKKFSFDKSIREDNLILRAKKNKEVVMIPIYPALAEILEQVKNIPFYFTEQSMRKYVKELATLCGIGRKIKVHTARHTFAITLLLKGFTIEEIAEMMGISNDVAKIYARVTNVQLHNKVKEKLG